MLQKVGEDVDARIGTAPETNLWGEEDEVVGREEGWNTDVRGLLAAVLIWVLGPGWEGGKAEGVAGLESERG